MVRSCSYFQCKTVTGQKPLFHFPTSNAKRLPVWLENCGNMTITHLPQEGLRNKYICIDHFDKRFILNESGQRVRLSKLAVPTHYKGYQSTEEVLNSPIASTLQGNSHLTTLTPAQLKSRHLCEVHFEQCYKSNNYQRARLTGTAVPRHYRCVAESRNNISSVPAERPKKGNIKIKNLTKDALRNKYICIEHFEKRYIQNESGKRIRINKLAVPVHYRGDESTDITPIAAQDLNLMRASYNSRGPLIVQEEGNLPITSIFQGWKDLSSYTRPIKHDNPSNSSKTASDSLDNSQGELISQSEEDQQCPDLTVKKPNKVYHNYHKQICEELAKDYNHSNSNSRVGNKCTECERSIYGLQWWCLQCSGARCGKCALRMSHRAHYLLRAPAHSTHEQTKAVLAAIRQQLGDDFVRQEDIRHVDENGVDLTVADEPEVKAEPPELGDDPLDPLAESNPTEEDPLADCKPVITDDPLAFTSEDSPKRISPLKEPSIDYQPESNLNDLQFRFVPECQPDENSTYRPLGVEIYSPVHPGLETFELSLAQCSGIADFLCIEPVEVDANSIVPSEGSRDLRDDQSSDEDQRPPSIKRPRVPTHFTYTEDNSEDSIKEVDYEQPSPSHVESDTEQNQTKPWVQVLSSQEQNIIVNTIQKPKTQPPRIQVSSANEPQNILAKQQNVQTKRPWVQVISNIQKSTDIAKQKNYSSEQSHIEDLCEEQTSTVTEIQNNNNVVQPTDIQDSNQEEQNPTDITREDSIDKNTATANKKRKKKIIIVKKRPRIQYATHIQRDFKEPTENDDVDKDVQSITETDTLDINVSTEPTNTLLNLDDLIRDKVLEYPSDIEELT